jgi:hypothetical protein
MIHLHVTVQLQRGKMDEWSKIYEEHLLPPMNKHGQKLVGAWKTSIGTYDEVTDLYEFESLSEFERIRGELFKEPEIKKWVPRIWEIAGHEESKILVPLGYGELTR